MYELLIRQQPSRARMQGMGEKDRRHIDPPPVVQVFKRTENGSLSAAAPVPYMLVLHASLWLEKTGELDSSNLSYNISTMELVGSVTAPIQTILDTMAEDSYKIVNRMGGPNAHSLNAQNIVTADKKLVPTITTAPDELELIPGGNEIEQPSSASDSANNVNIGHFFIFSDLSVRSEGVFRLKFSLFDLSNCAPNSPPSNCLCEIFSDRFQVFSAKKFPGMNESTALSKSLALQGLKIPIRNEMRGGQDFSF